MAKKGKKHQSASQKQQFLAYQGENRQEKNKIQKLARHVKRNPDDVKAQANLKRIKQDGGTYKRGNQARGSVFIPKKTQVEAYIDRQCKTGANTVDKEGKLLQKPLPRPNREKKKFGMEYAMELVGLKRGRFSKRMR